MDERLSHDEIREWIRISRKLVRINPKKCLINKLLRDITNDLEESLTAKQSLDTIENVSKLVM